MLYQELTHAPILPFTWQPKEQQPRIFSSLASGAEGTCTLMSEQVADFATPLPSPCPGSLCAALLHLPRQAPVLIVSVYSQTPKRPEVGKA